MVDHQRLDIGGVDGGGGGSVAHVADGGVRPPEIFKLSKGEYLRHQTGGLVDLQPTVLRHSDAAGVLPPMLEGEEGVIGVKGRLPAPVRPVDETEDAALLFQFLHSDRLFTHRY